MRVIQCVRERETRCSRGLRVLMIQDGHAHDSLRVTEVRGLQLRGDLSLPLIPPVLKPDFHLSLGEVERRGEPGPFRAAQVPFQVERGLELKHLRAREHGPGLLLSTDFLL